MKTLEFKTSKGSFMLVDSLEIEGIKLSEITEQQASEIVDESLLTGLYAYYVKNIDINTYCYNTSIDSLHSLIESKEVYLYDNPISKDVEYSDELCKYCPLFKKGVYSVNGGYVAGCEGCCCETAKENHEDMYQESEQKTFYNPVIFKL